MSSRCTWPASFLAAGCFVCACVSPQYAHLHMFSICIYGVVVFVYQCTYILQSLSNGRLLYLYTPTTRLPWLWNSQTFYMNAKHMNERLMPPPHFPCPMSVFKQEEGSGGVRLSEATSKTSKAAITPYLDRHGLTCMCTLTDTHWHNHDLADAHALVFSHFTRRDLKSTLSLSPG